MPMPCLFWIGLPWVAGPLMWFETMRMMGLTNQRGWDAW